VLFTSQLLAGWQGMQDQMLKGLNLVSHSGNVDQLLGLLLRSSHGSFVKHVLEEVRHAKDDIGPLWKFVLVTVPCVFITRSQSP
jgi:hypothetical protein